VQALVCLLNRVLSLQILDSGRFDRGQKFNTSPVFFDPRDAFSFGDRDWLGSHAAISTFCLTLVLLLFSYGPDAMDQFQHAAGCVDRILKGENLAELPVQAPIKFDPQPVFYGIMGRTNLSQRGAGEQMRCADCRDTWAQA
jgi:hypothetical protein